MTIVYTVVARGSVVLAEYSGTQTNASTIGRQIMEKIGGDDDINVSYSQDRFIFHVKRIDGLTVLCMADDVSGRRVPFAFLEDIHQIFVRTYGRAVLSAQAYGMNDEFSRVLSQQMEYYSNDPNADRINRLKGEIGQVRTVMLQNIDEVLERGDRLELLVDKTATMKNDTLRFKKVSSIQECNLVEKCQAHVFSDISFSGASVCCCSICLQWADPYFLSSVMSGEIYCFLGRRNQKREKFLEQAMRVIICTFNCSKFKTLLSRSLLVRSSQLPFSGFVE